PVEDLGNGKYRVSARLSIEDLGELFGMEIAEEDVDTVGGLLAHALGRVPLPGSKAVIHGLQLRGEGGSDTRGRVRVHTVGVRHKDEPGAKSGAAVKEPVAGRSPGHEEEAGDD